MREPNLGLSIVKVAMMQPYLLPSLSYFNLICWADVFVSLECVNYKKRGWINRNRVLHPDQSKDWAYVTMPVKNASQNSKIEEILVESKRDFFAGALSKISAYKNKTRFYDETAKYLTHLDDLVQEQHAIAKINVAIIKDLTCRLDLDCDILTDSDVDFPKTQIHAPEDWAIEITSALGGSVYANPIGGAKLYQSSSFLERNVALRFLRSSCEEYDQGGREFQRNLSIIDVLLWNGFEQCSRLVKEFAVIRPEHVTSLGCFENAK